MTYWYEQYLGLPWSLNPEPPKSFNCGEFVRWIFKVHRNQDSPFILADTSDIRSCIKDISMIKRYCNFERVSMPQDFDIALMARRNNADHVGISVGNDILHCRPKVGVFLDDLFTLRSMGWNNIQFIRVTGDSVCQ